MIHYWKSLGLDDAQWCNAIFMFSAQHRIDKSTTINATGIVINSIVYRPKTPGTRLQIKIVFNFRLIRNIKNILFHNLDCTSRRYAKGIIRKNLTNMTSEMDIAKIVIRITVTVINKIVNWTQPPTARYKIKLALDSWLDSWLVWIEDLPFHKTIISKI